MKFCWAANIPGEVDADVDKPDPAATGSQAVLMGGKQTSVNNLNALLKSIVRQASSAGLFR